MGYKTQRGGKEGNLLEFLYFYWIGSSEIKDNINKDLIRRKRKEYQMQPTSCIREMAYMLFVTLFNPLGYNWTIKAT